MNILHNDYLYSDLLTYNKDSLVSDCLNFEKSLKSTIKNGHKIPSLTGSFTTANFYYYNIFSYHTPELNRLLKNLKISIYPVLESKEYVFQSWVNIYRKNEFIDWHSHDWEGSKKSYHGYFCVDVEPSITSYIIPGGFNIDVQNKNGMLIFGKSAGDAHKTTEWKYDIPRITIAFDIIPLDIYTREKYSEHFIVF